MAQLATRQLRGRLILLRVPWGLRNLSERHRTTCSEWKFVAQRAFAFYGTIYAPIATRFPYRSDAPSANARSYQRGRRKRQNERFLERQVERVLGATTPGVAACETLYQAKVRAKNSICDHRSDYQRSPVQR
jgi:hypothetical protein